MPAETSEGLGGPEHKMGWMDAHLRVHNGYPLVSVRYSGASSMSTAVVSGAVALVLQQRQDLRPDQVKRAVTASTQRFGWLGPLPHARGRSRLGVNAGGSDGRGSAPGSPSGCVTNVNRLATL
jgi:subtilisin family serine protease